MRGLPNQAKVVFAMVSTWISILLSLSNRPNVTWSSPMLQPSVIDSFLQTELDKGRIAGPFATSPMANLHGSLFGLIPKTHHPAKWILILDLSSPAGASANDGRTLSISPLHFHSHRIFTGMNC